MMQQQRTSLALIMKSDWWFLSQIIFQKRLLTFRHSSGSPSFDYWMKKQAEVKYKGKRNPPQNHHHLHRFQFFSHEVALKLLLIHLCNRNSDSLDWPWKNEVENWEEEEKFKLYSIDCVKHGIFFPSLKTVSDFNARASFLSTVLCQAIVIESTLINKIKKDCSSQSYKHENGITHAIVVNSRPLTYVLSNALL